jgi:hypothetical protein
MIFMVRILTLGMVMTSKNISCKYCITLKILSKCVCSITEMTVDLYITFTLQAVPHYGTKVNCVTNIVTASCTCSLYIGFNV